MNFNFLDNDEKKLVYPIIFIAFLIRLLFIVETTGSPFVENLFSDSEIYTNYAEEIVDSGNWIGDEAFFMAPVYPYSIAVVKLIFGDSTLVLRFLQVIISSLTLIFIYLSAKNYFNRNTALLALIISGFFSSYIFYAGIIFSETFQVFTIAVLIYLFSLRDKQSQIKYWLLTGFVFGIAVLLRGNILLFLPVIFIYLLVDSKLSKRITLSRVKVISIFVLGTFAAIIPVTLRNLAVSGEFVLLTTNGGINFYIGNNQDAIGVFVTPDEFNFAQDMSGKEYAERITGAELSASEASTFWYNKTLDEITDNPIKFVELIGRKFLLFFDAQPFPQSSILDMDFYRRHYSNVLKLPLIEYSVISLLFIMGIIIYIKQKQIDYLLLLFTIVYILATILFFVNGRFRLGITPVMIIFSSFGAIKVFEYIKSAEYKKLQVPAFILILFIATSYFIIDKPVFTNYDAYLQLGDIAQENERYEEAIYNYNRSIVLRDYYQTFMNLGNTFAKKRDFRNALSAFAEAEKRNPDDHLLYFNRGIVYSQLGDYNKAIEAYKKCLELYADFPPAIRNTGIIYFVNENYSDAQFYFNKFLEISNDEATKALVRKDLETIRRKLGGN